MHRGPATSFQGALRSGGVSASSSPTLCPVALPVAMRAAHTPLPPRSSAWARGYLAARLPGRATITPPLVSIAAHSGPPYSAEDFAGPSLRLRRRPIRRRPIRSTVSLSNRFESPGRGRSLANHRGDKVRATNRRPVLVPSSPPPLTVANPRAALRQPGGGGLWVKRRKQPTNQVAPTPYPPTPTHRGSGLRLGAQAPVRVLIGCRRLGPIPVTPKCWKEGAGVAQCKVHPESPLSGHPAADTSDQVRLGVFLSPDLLSPSVAGSLWPGARQTPGLSPWTGTAPPPPPPTQADTSSQHPFPETAQRPRSPPPASSAIWMLSVLGP